MTTIGRVSGARDFKKDVMQNKEVTVTAGMRKVGGLDCCLGEG